MPTYPAIQDTPSSKTSIEGISAGAVVLVVTAWSMVFPSASVKVEAVHAPAVNIDVGSPAFRCTQQAWPHYAPSCLRDQGEAVGEIRTVRIVPIDRMQPSMPITTVYK